MTTQRLLPGLKRIDSNVWWWGCWRIEKVADTRFPFWIATDKDSPIGLWEAYERALMCSDSLDNVKYLIDRLARLGPNPVVQEAAR